MSRPRYRALLAVLAIGCLTAAAVAAAPSAGAAPFGFTRLTPQQQRHVSGLLASELNPRDAARQAVRAPGRVGPQRVTPFGCPNRFDDNVKVNQNCLNISDPDLQGRGQSQNETFAAADPGNPAHVVASYNDYRRGDGNCGVSYTLDGGLTWADSTVPNGFTRGAPFGAAREYWQAGGDTSVAWDSRGNAYLSCQQFNRGAGTSPDPDQSSAFYVYRSTGTAGASWTFTGRPVAEIADTTATGGALLDKQLLTVDNNPGSPFRDRLYVSWTTFAADGTAYIFEAHSQDYGETFSAPVLVSGNTTLCDNTLGAPTPHGSCNQNQDSQPFTGPDGALYVVFNNFNNAVTGTENRNQVLLARSTDGGVSFGAPVRVGFFNDLPDCATYQNGKDPGRACVPEKGPSADSIFRSGNYPIGGVDPQHPGRISVTYGSYLNRDSNESTPGGGCTPAGLAADGVQLYTGVKTGPCNNDIVLSTSADSGATFTGSGTDVRSLPVVTADPGQARTDQFWQGAGFAPDGRLVVSYFDRQYGQDETTGFADLSGSAADGRGGFLTSRVTSASMPPPTQFDGTFMGDYTGISVSARAALPLWPDTRPVDLFLCAGTARPGVPPQTCLATAPNAAVANDQDIFAGAVLTHRP
jgi:hypothetical protein